MKPILSIVLLLFINGCFAQEQFTVYFESNKSDLTPKERLRLEDWMYKNSKSKIVAINGYTDEVGTTAYNDSLAQKRVDFISEFVLEKVPIRDDFKTRSYGEKFNQSENRAENRKATIYYILEKDLHRENEILGIKDIVIDENLPLFEKIKLAKKGTKIRLKDINFFQNTFAITPESNNALNDLLYVMQNNPTLQIEIQGHICCVSSDRRKLSLERAKQVRRFLVAKGIPITRMAVTGFGINHPIYPIPEANEEQAAANRRVEIEILSK
ncbi:OmpA family protein [Flavobacterium profundi]|uniref:OmpA family protein n=1 Tax=Flavobacterium profundi TaxID=1774945 RepID=UPI00293BA75F|nr:OmpA family protein [Flavobacterium profundi]